MDVSHVSLNHGDLNDARSGRVPEGAVLGPDAADGSGPAAGARVVAMTPGAFARRVAVDVAALAVVPGSLYPARAVGLPVAGIAALCSLRAAGLAPDRRVLVTGASGGVGRFAVQLAARAGAQVIASVGSAARAGRGRRGRGAGRSRRSRPARGHRHRQRRRPAAGRRLEPARPGRQPAERRLDLGSPAVFPPYATVGPAKSLTSFVHEGAAGVEIGRQGSWERFTEAAEELRGRRIRGKAVLEVARA